MLLLLGSVVGWPSEVGSGACVSEVKSVYLDGVEPRECDVNGVGGRLNLAGEGLEV